MLPVLKFYDAKKSFRAKINNNKWKNCHMHPYKESTNGNEKIILIYDTLYGSFDSWKHWWGSDEDQFCSEPNVNIVYHCHIYIGKHYLLEKAELVIFSWFQWDRMPSSPIPPKRDGQLWALVTQDSPFDRWNLNMPIDWVMTYESKADIKVESGVVARRGKDTGTLPSYKLSKARKFGAIFINKCDAISKRDDLIRDLQNQNLIIDVYGNCGNMVLNSSSLRAYKYLSRRYKFFFALEDAICRDYVTIKFYYALMFPWIPIVLGGGKYSSVAPPKSYVSVMDFLSIQSLTKYLKHLDGNETAYLEYFYWKSEYDVKIKMYQGCKACIHLHKYLEHRGRVPNLAEFSQERQCFTPNSTNDLFSAKYFLKKI